MDHYIVIGHGPSRIDAIRRTDSELSLLDAGEAGASLSEQFEKLRSSHDDYWCVAIEESLVSEDELDADPAVTSFKLVRSES